MRLLFSIAFALTAWSAAWAQDYPNKPIRVVVPFAAGGASDSVSRVFSQELSTRLGQPVIVENRPGATGVIGADAVAKSAPDGHMLLMAVISSHAIAPVLGANVPYHPLKDFTPIVKVGDSAMTLVAANSLPVSNVRELIAHAKANPGKLTYGSSGIGSIFHLAGEMFSREAGISMVHVPYKGDAPALADMMAGVLDLLFTPTPGPAVKAGRVKPLGIASEQRRSSTPTWPTIAESGLKFQMSSWTGLMGPAGMQRAVVMRLNETGNEIIKSAAFVKRLEDLGYDPAGGSPEDFAAAIRNDMERFGKLGIKLN
jgi:tripartite-type tricarboxylate transporter receptor subunit TctC